MIFRIAFAIAGMGLFASSAILNQSSVMTLRASGRGNCPVYYGCPSPQPPPPSGGGGGGKHGGTDNPPGKHLVDQKQFFTYTVQA